MFKFFKKKLKHSDWMEGLLLAESLYKQGYVCIDSKPSFSYMWFDSKSNPKQMFGICVHDSRYDGVIDYLDHKKYMDSLDK